MVDKQYVSESILQFILKTLDELKQQPHEPINVTMLQSLVERATQQS